MHQILNLFFIDKFKIKLQKYKLKYLKRLEPNIGFDFFANNIIMTFYLIF